MSPRSRLRGSQALRFNLRSASYEIKCFVSECTVARALGEVKFLLQGNKTRV